MVYETILWRVPLGFQRTEKRLFCAKNLHGGCWCLGEVREGASLADQSRSHRVSDESAQVWRNDRHFVRKVHGQVLAELCQLDHSLREVDDIDHVDGGTIHAHAGLGGRDDRLRGLLVANDLNKAFQLVARIFHLDIIVIFVFLVAVAACVARVGQGGLVLDECRGSRKHDVVLDDLLQLRKVPAVPFSDPHGERVDVLVHLIEQGD
mmetsp:Transcript_21773/g.61983  ORF Transcript_21773/g.61983 Transcript_21773/m.61983 type:complete len:207 (+) Transcript_21773:568-1188(+)